MMSRAGRRSQAAAFGSPVAALGGLCVALAVGFSGGSLHDVTAAEPPRVDCRLEGALMPLAGIGEASGLAASRRVPGRFYTHNDSGEPVVTALDSSGAIVGRVTVAGATVDDWEAVTVAPCESGDCLYIADIGDNDQRRPTITIYRAPEPGATLTDPVQSEAFRGSYPDGPHDAETLLIANRRLYIVTKDARESALYAFPETLQGGPPMPLERIGVARGQTPLSRITDGAISPDGAWVALRSNTELAFYPAAEFLRGQWQEAARISLGTLNEPQGEGVAFGTDTQAVVVAGESGSGGRGGTFARLSCRWTP
jgi:hypothetical protein